jgi:hypothetical protein
MTKEEKEGLTFTIEQQLKEALVNKGYEVETYSDQESAISKHGLNVKGHEWEIEIAIYPKR